MDGIKNRQRAIWLTGIAILVAVLFILLLIGPRLASYYYSAQAISFFVKGDFISAKPLFEKSIKFNSKNPEPYFYLGKIALGKITATPTIGPFYPNADYSSAADNLGKAIYYGLEIKNKELYFSALNDIGFSYQMLKDFEKADQNFLLLIEKDTGQSIARYFVSLNYIERFNKPKEALDILNPIVSRVESPAAETNLRGMIEKANLYRVYVMLARLSFYFNNQADAEKYAQLAVKNSGQQRDLDAALAHALLALAAGAKKDFATTDKEIANANEFVGSPSTFECVKADAYFIGGDISKAINIALSRKRTENYAYSLCLSTLADAYNAMENSVKAKEYYQEYLALTDKFPEKNIFVARDRQRFIDKLQK